MAYNTQIRNPGDIIYSADHNQQENQIAANTTAIEQLANTTVPAIQEDLDEVVGKVVLDTGYDTVAENIHASVNSEAAIRENADGLLADALEALGFVVNSNGELCQVLKE